MQLISKALAQVDLNGAINVTTTDTSISGLVQTVITWMLYIAGVLAFIYLVYSGILYITAAGNPDQAKKGQQGIINAVIGIVVVTLAFVILKAVSGSAQNQSISSLFLI